MRRVKPKQQLAGNRMVPLVSPFKFIDCNLIQKLGQRFRVTLDRRTGRRDAVLVMKLQLIFVTRWALHDLERQISVVSAGHAETNFAINDHGVLGWVGVSTQPILTRYSWILLELLEIQYNVGFALDLWNQCQGILLGAKE
jgi:hypothetical protein